MLRAVIAGCGAMSRGWLRALAETPAPRGRVEVVGLVDLDPGRAEALAAEFGLRAAVGDDLAAMLDRLSPDVVFDVVVPEARAQVVETALARGCHVLSEKPMAASMAQARRLVRLAEARGRLHAVIQNRRFAPGVRRLRRLVEEGVIGTVTAVHCDFFLAPHFGGFREEMDHALLLDMAVHAFDAGRFVLGRRPLAVYCHESNPEGSWYRHGAAANAIFEFEGGAVLTYRGSWAAEGAPTSWEGAWRVIGTRGTALWDGAERFEVGVRASDEGFFREIAALPMPEAPDPAATLGHASVIADFLRAVETGGRPETAGHDAIQSLAMVFAAIESAGARARVAVEPTALPLEAA